MKAEVVEEKVTVMRLWRIGEKFRSTIAVEAVRVFESEKCDTKEDAEKRAIQYLKKLVTKTKK